MLIIPFLFSIAILTPAPGDTVEGWKVSVVGPGKDAKGNFSNADCSVYYPAVITREQESKHVRLFVACSQSGPKAPIIIENENKAKNTRPAAQKETKVSSPSSLDEKKVNETRRQTRGNDEKIKKIGTPQNLDPKVLAPSKAEGEKLKFRKKGEKASSMEFLKGELTEFGITQLRRQENSFVLGLGITNIESTSYLSVRPELRLQFENLAFGLGAPLRFEIFSLENAASGGSVTAGTGGFRGEDWDQIEDVLRPLRFITWGKKEDGLYIDLNRGQGLTLGHGQLLRRYAPTVDIDEDNLFAELDAYGDAGGVELLAGPFPLPRVIGGLFFIKPLGLFKEDFVSKSFSIGFSYVSDLNAPDQIFSAPNLADQRTQLAVLDDGNLASRNSEQYIGDVVQGLGIDSELKIIKTENIDVKIYGDLSTLRFPQTPDFDAFSDVGLTGGAIFRLNFGRKVSKDSPSLDDENAPSLYIPKHAFRIRLEARSFGPQFLPSYFNELYEMDKLQFGFGTEPNRAQLPTKWAYLAGQEDASWRGGGYLEASWQIPDKFAFTFIYEDAFSLGSDGDIPAARNFALHAETNNVKALQLFATYHYRHFEDFGDLFSFSNDNEIFYFGGRVRVLPFLFLNLAAQRSFRIAFSPDDLPGQKRTLSGEDDGSERYRFSSIGNDNIWAGAFEIELGWQW